MISLKQPVIIVGLGKTGYACIEFLNRQGMEFQVVDTREEPPFFKQTTEKFPQIKPILGPFKERDFKNVGTLIVSPGVSLKSAAIQKAQQAGADIIGDVELFAQRYQGAVIAITGSNGKSTVTDLTFELLKALGKSTAMAGNIGTPVLSLMQRSQADYVVLELSSFQLDSTHSLQAEVAVALNVTPDHLDRYDNFAEYLHSKLSVYLNANKAIVPYDNNWGLNLSQDWQSFGFNNNASFNVTQLENEDWITVHGKPWMDVSSIALQGKHNWLNILASLALIDSLDISLWGQNQQILKLCLQQYKGLPHRCEKVMTSGNILWINDSKSTNVGSTMAAISGFSDRYSGKMVLIVGGDAKGADLTELKTMIHNHVSTLITLGKDGPMLANQITQTHVIQVTTLLQAVQAAAENVPEFGLVLLSPACASLDMFANYIERGNQFCEAVMEIAA